MCCLPTRQPRARIYAAAAMAFERAGYGRIETPVFEETELFERGVGSSTDIVQKEMFTFEDQGGRSLTLRPEATASICRAYVEHGMHKLPQPVKLWCWGPFFRHERPQAGPPSPVSPDRRGGDRNDLAAGGRRGRSSSSTTSCATSTCPGSSSGWEAWARLRTQSRLPRGARRLSALARGRALRGRSRRASTQNPLRAFDSDHEGTQRGDA